MDTTTWVALSAAYGISALIAAGMFHGAVHDEPVSDRLPDGIEIAVSIICGVMWPVMLLLGFGTWIVRSKRRRDEHRRSLSDDDDDFDYGDGSP